MNEIIEIKTLLNRYYEGESTDVDEQRLCEYFSSGNVAAELQPYRSIFAYLQHEKEQPPLSEEGSLETAAIIEPAIQPRPIKWWYAAATAAACILAAIFLAREYRPEPAPQALCSGTYVMVNGVCYDDLSLVSKYATEAIDQVTEPVGENSATDALDFLTE